MGTGVVSDGVDRRRRRWWVVVAFVVVTLLVLAGMLWTEHRENQLRSSGDRLTVKVLRVDSGVATVDYSVGGDRYVGDLDIAGAKPPVTASTRSVVVAADHADPGRIVVASVDGSRVLANDLLVVMLVDGVLAVVAALVAVAWRTLRRRGARGSEPGTTHPRPAVGPT